MIPRRDPATNPVLLGVQFRMRSTRDRYGAELARNPVTRPVRTRNGLPVRHYRNWREPRPSMTPDEAEAWLIYRYRSPGGTP
jgi:hypothetical protein